MPADHLAPAGGGEYAALRRRVELGEETREVAGGADEAGRRGEGARRVEAGNDHAVAERELGAVAPGHRDARAERRIRLGFPQAGRRDDGALDPVGIGLAGDGLDDETGEAVAVVRIFEAAIRIEHGRCAQRSLQLAGVEERAAVLPLAGVGAVADKAGAVREQLRDRRLGHGRMQPLDVAADGIVELQLALLAQFHDTGGGEALGV
jgi:hypothetical protein